MKRIVIEFEDIDVSTIDSIDISFQDQKPYVTKSWYETDENGKQISRYVTEPYKEDNINE